MVPKKITKQELLNALDDIRASVQACDSFEGSLSYSCMDDECQKDEFMVSAAWRIGNTEGQGGMRMISGGEVDYLFESEASKQHKAKTVKKL